jgi:CheY-like chemotaxis protein
MNEATVGGRVLIVDDEPVTANLYAVTLENAGYAVLLAASADEANALLTARHFDLVFLDLYFPGTGGWEFLRDLRERFSAAELPVLMSSSESNAGVRESLLALGANDFLVKPVTPAHLIQSARQWTGR